MVAPRTDGADAHDIANLAFTDQFVTDLPGDPRTDNALRQVHRACYSRTLPTPVARPELLVVVPEVAALVELDPSPTPELTEVLAGNRVVPGMTPYAACYGGHQFGTWAGQLGDGRAITLGEVTLPHLAPDLEGEHRATWELQLKGAGPTPYSRRADGRAVLRSSLRELVCSEAMFHLGVPTTRALSLALTGELVQRDLLYDGHPRYEPGAVVCRVAPSFLRFGSYEIHSARDDHATLRTLVRFTIERFYPTYLDRASGQLDVAGWFGEVVRRTAFLVAEWMRVGFVHGVMNTDNMSILGLTIDYGPYGWLESFDLDWTPNITDSSGRRYRFGNQPSVAHWNLSQLAKALAPLCDDVAPLSAALDGFVREFSSQYRHGTLRKLGLSGLRAFATLDEDLLAALGTLLVETETDMTLWFRRLAQVPRALMADPAAAFAILSEASYAPSAITPLQHAQLAAWLAQYGARIDAEQLGDAERRARMA